MSELDKSEYQRIEAAIRATEQAMAGNPHIRTDAAAAMLEPSKKRLEVLEQDGFAPHQDDDKRKKEGQTAVAVAYLVMQETRLNSEEKQAYGSFLQKDYFTRNDLADLEDFYADGGAWDKLTKKGKEEMFIRLDEGIQRGEIEFSELSPTMRQKHMETPYLEFTQSKSSNDSIFRDTPPEAREEFIREYEAGNYEAAREVLNLQGVKLDSVTKDQNQAATERSEVADGTKISEDKSLAQKAERNQTTDDELESLSALTDLPKISQSGNPLGKG